MMYQIRTCTWMLYFISLLEYRMKPKIRQSLLSPLCHLCDTHACPHSYVAKPKQNLYKVVDLFLLCQVDYACHERLLIF